MKRSVALSLLCVSLVLVLFLSACGSKEGNTEQENSTPASNQNEQAIAEKETEPVTIKFHTHGNEDNYNWAHTIAAFEAAHDNIKVDLVMLSDKGDSMEALQKLDLAASSNEQLDVLMFSDPASYAQRVGHGMVAPLDDYINEEGFNFNEEYKVDTLLNGSYYALPGKFNPWYVLLNKDLLTVANLDVPVDWTWDDFVHYAKELTTGEGANKHYGTFFHGPQGGGWMEFLKLALASKEENTEYVKADGTSNLDDPMFRKTLELRLKMEQEDQSSTPYADIISQKLHYRAQFFNQSTSMLLIGSWMNTEIGGTEQFPLEFDVAVAPYPKNELSDGGYTPVTTDFMAIAQKSQHKDAAYEFIRWYTTEGQIVQGKNIPSWNKVADSDLEQIIDTILSDTLTPERVDKQSLISVLSNAQSSKIIPPVTYQSEIYTALNEEYEKMIFGINDLDTTLEVMKERVQNIIDMNQ